jgi:hypothetical protein
MRPDLGPSVGGHEEDVMSDLWSVILGRLDDPVVVP